MNLGHYPPPSFTLSLSLCFLFSLFPCSLFYLIEKKAIALDWPISRFCLNQKEPLASPKSSSPCNLLITLLLPMGHTCGEQHQSCCYHSRLEGGQYQVSYFAPLICPPPPLPQNNIIHQSQALADFWLLHQCKWRGGYHNGAVRPLDDKVRVAEVYVWLLKADSITITSVSAVAREGKVSRGFASKVNAEIEDDCLVDPTQTIRRHDGQRGAGTNNISDEDG